jgi:hypothetical protein
VINSGAEFATNKSVKLTLIAPNGETSAQIANDQPVLKWSKWVPLAAGANQVDWKLVTGDGPKTVKVQFSDGSQISSVWMDSIILDTKAPVGTVAINSKAIFTKTPTVTVTVAATDATSGMNALCIREDSILCAANEFIPFVAIKEHQIASPGDGKKTLFVSLRDNAGLVSKPLKATITLDTIPPQGGSIIINGGKSSTTTSPVVALKLVAVKAAQMKLSLDGGATWGEWEKFAGSKTVTLSGGLGEKVVKVMYRDVAGNETVPYSAVITLVAAP